MTFSDPPRARRLSLDAHSSVPLYRTVQQRMLQLLASGEWKPGDRLPNEAELAQKFGVASLTLRAGIADLVAAGLLHRRPGRGTYVARHEAYGPQSRYSNVYENEGGKVSGERQVQWLRHRAATSAQARLLGLDPRARLQVCEVEFLVRRDGVPVASTNIVLPLPLFEALRRQHIAEREENLYSVYQSRCGVTVLRMEERIYGCVADAKWAKRLELPAGHPLLRVERIGYTYNNVPVELRYRTYDGSKYHYLFTHDNL